FASSPLLDQTVNGPRRTRIWVQRSTPDDLSWIDPKAAFPANGRRHRDLTLFAMWADIGVEQNLHGLAKPRTAFRAGRILKLESPDPVASGTTVMGDDLHRPIDHVLLRRRIAPNLVRGLTLGRTKPGHQERQRVFSLRIEDFDTDVEVDRILLTDRLAQFRQGL